MSRRALILTVLLTGVAIALVVFAAERVPREFDPDPAFSVGPISSTMSHQIAKLDEVASKLAGHSTVVNCWSQQDWERFQTWQSAHDNSRAVKALGVTYPDTRRIQLSPFVCQVLAQVLVASAHQPLFTAAAVNVLAHESAHASGIDAESRAECRAIETDPETARLLGLPNSVAVQLQHIYRGTLYPYDESRYRTPTCRAGLPGEVVADTLGNRPSLEPFVRAAAAVVRVLPGWKNIGGGGAFVPLSPCSPAITRADESARFGEDLRGGNGRSVFVSGVRLRTRAEFTTAIARSRLSQRCEDSYVRRQMIESGLSATVNPGKEPRSFKRLPADVFAFRDIWTNGGKRWDRDTLFVFAPRESGWMRLSFRFAAGTLDGSVEVRAVKAVLRASHGDR